MLNGHIPADAGEGDPRELPRGAEQVLLGVGPPLDIAGEVEGGGHGYHEGEPAGPRVALREDEEGHPVPADELEEHPGRLRLPALGRRDADEVVGEDPLTALAAEGLDAKGELLEGPSREEKRTVALDEEDPVAERIPHSGATSSDWQLGHIGCFPTPLNFSPQLRHL